MLKLLLIGAFVWAAIELLMRALDRAGPPPALVYCEDCSRPFLDQHTLSLHRRASHDPEPMTPTWEALRDASRASMASCGSEPPSLGDVACRADTASPARTETAPM